MFFSSLYYPCKTWQQCTPNRGPEITRTDRLNEKWPSFSNKQLCFCTQPHPVAEGHVITAAQISVSHLNVAEESSSERRAVGGAGRSKETADRPFPDLLLLRKRLLATYV